MSRLLALIVCASALSAQAQWLETPYRIFFTGGAAARNHTQSISVQAFDAKGGLLPGQTVERDTAVIEVLSPANFHLSAAVFPHRFFGIDFEARGEVFTACCDSRLPNQKATLPSVDGSVSAVGRALPTSWLGLELHVGLQTLLRTGIDPNEVPMYETRTLTRGFVGPVGTVAIALAPSRSFQVMLFGRFGLALGALSGLNLAAGAQASFGAIKLGPVQLGFGPSFEFSDSEVGQGRALNALHARNVDLRFGVGITLQKWVEERDVVPLVAAPKPLVGRVVLQDGTSAVDARVSLDGAAATTTDVNGRFTFATVTEGPHRLEASKENVTPASLEVTAPMEKEVVLTLGAPTGPGRITGVVKQPSGLLSGATISTTTEPIVTVKSAEDGSYTLEKVGPGPVTVKVKADEFNDAEEVAQVAPGGMATLDFAMVPKAVSVQATLRGLIRAKSGDAVKATVRIVELKLKLQVKGDGRFSAEVPSGKYTLIIEARGYVTQTKTVEVSGGDQAIFHTELERAR